MKESLKRLVAVGVIIFGAGLLHMTVSAEDEVTLGLDNIVVVAVEETDFVSYGATLALLSPDGERVAYVMQEGVCVFPVAFEGDFEAEVCAPFPERFRVDMASLRWSPGGDAIVFTENVAAFFVDTDIYVFDVAQGVIRNLTDDGHRGNISPDHPIDIAPTWSDDGEWLYFLRYEGFEDGATLWRVHREDETLESIMPLGSTSPLSTFAFALSGDGQIAYTLIQQNATGLYVASLEDGAVTTLYESDSVGLQAVYVDFLNDWQLLVMLPYEYFYRDVMLPVEPGMSIARVFDIPTGEFIFIDPERLVTSAVWSPDGSLIAYLAEAGDGTEGVARRHNLYVTDALGVPGKLLLEGIFTMPSGNAYQPLTWSENNVITVSDVRREWRLTLVQLGVDD